MCVPFHRRPSGTETEFFVQLFVEFDESLKNPTIENLLQKMFREQQISFASVRMLSHSLTPSLHFSSSFLLPTCLSPPSGPIQAAGTGPEVWETVQDLQEDHSWNHTGPWLSHGVTQYDRQTHMHTHPHTHTSMHIQMRAHECMHAHTQPHSLLY